MSPETYLDGRVRLYAGDCLEVLRGLPDDSIDSVVTDPPYGLARITKRFGAAGAKPVKAGDVYARASAGFMGKTWDTGKRAFAAEFWSEVLRVLKPGGHVAAFGGTRTVHRLACAIEDSGFEIRDELVRLFDPAGDAGAFLAGLSDGQAEALARLCDAGAFGGRLEWIYGTGFPKSLDISKAIDKAAGAKRAVVATETVRDIRSGNGRAQGEGIHASGRDGPVYMQRDITAPATPEAEAWRGWGTALKPAHEPIVLARKPFPGTVAATVLEHGTGGINVDGCRVGCNEDTRRSSAGGANGLAGTGTFKIRQSFASEGVLQSGRHPANVLHDGSGGVTGMFPAEAGGAGKASGPSLRGENVSVARGRFSGLPDGVDPAFYGDTGSAARFFYSAKADDHDRIGSKHPTVKPVDLMQWLVRLITPPGGTVLDPFAGTGTTGEAAWREGFSAVLIEREAEYRADIARRMALALAGPATRRAEGHKARGTTQDHGPLFGDSGVRGGRQIYGHFADQDARSALSGSSGE